MTTCTVCREPMPGHPDDDVCCLWCDNLNLAGDPLRYPPRQQRTPVPWWMRERLELATRVVPGPWVWTPEHGIEETP